MKAGDSLYVTLASNDFSFKGNKISNYQTHLAKPLIFNGALECALTNILFTKSYYTIHDSNAFLRKCYGVIKSETEHKFFIPKGSFDKENDSCVYISKLLQTSFRAVEKNSGLPPSLNYNRNKQKFVLTTGYGSRSKTYIVQFSPNLNNILGFPNTKAEFDFTDFRKLYKQDEMIETKRGVRFRTMELDADVLTEDKENFEGLPEKIKQAWNKYVKNVIAEYSELKKIEHILKGADIHHQYKLEVEFVSTFKTIYRNVFVYCDIIMPSFLGSTYLKILRIVDIPKTCTFGDQVVKEFDRLNYVKVAVTELQDIEIHIKDEFDQNVAFEIGTYFVTLHLRRCHE